MNKLYVGLISLLAFLTFDLKSVANDHPPAVRVPFYVYNAANEFKLDVALLYAICKVESNCKARAINHNDGTAAQKAAGIIDKSYGMFQIKASTAEWLGFTVKEEVTVDAIRRGKLVKVTKTIDHTKDLIKPDINAWYAAKLLRILIDRYENPVKAISAYNAGHYTRGNKDYVNKVLAEYALYKLDRKF